MSLFSSQRRMVESICGCKSEQHSSLSRAHIKQGTGTKSNVLLDVQDLKDTVAYCCVRSKICKIT